jgi:nitrile hydratase
MNSIHDLGGMHGFGPVPIEPNEPYFHADWERRMFGIASAIAYPLDFNDDQFRREIERIPPGKYLTSSYYELWFYGILGILEERGIATLQDIDHFEPSGERKNYVDGVVKGDMVDETIIAGASAQSATIEVPKVIQVGDAVRIKNNHPHHHHRAPRYIRGRQGKVIFDHGAFNFPDTNSEYRGLKPQHVYAVEFSGAELWGDDADPETSVTIDVFESYMDRLSGED